MPYMGKSENNIIQLRTELLSEAGKTINIPLIASLKGSGVTGSQVLDGNEEDLQNFNAQVWSIGCGMRSASRSPRSI
jgi:hypothetical protein